MQNLLSAEKLMFRHCTGIKKPICALIKGVFGGKLKRIKFVQLCAVNT